MNMVIKYTVCALLFLACFQLHAGQIPCDNNVCGSHGYCNETQGQPGYKCTCYRGFINNNTCVDRDECSMSKNLCQNGSCVNTIGSYHCDCHNGYNGTHCQSDIDECQSGACKARPNTACENTPGSYRCSCYPGYFGTDCHDRDECAMVQGLCNNGTCVNTPGSFVCNCNAGFNGSHCTDYVDKCKSSPCAHGTCTNTPGSYKCTCEPGFGGPQCAAATSTIKTSTRLTSTPTTHRSTKLTTLSTKKSTVSTTVKTSSIKQTTMSTRKSVVLSTTVKTSSSKQTTLSTRKPTQQTLIPTTSNGPKLSSARTSIVNRMHPTLSASAQNSDNKSWVGSHWYIFLIAGLVLAATVSVVIAVVKRKRKSKNLFEYKDMKKNSGSEPTTPTSQTNIENPLYAVVSKETMPPTNSDSHVYAEFHGQESGVSEL